METIINRVVGEDLVVSQSGDRVRVIDNCNFPLTVNEMKTGKLNFLPGRLLSLQASAPYLQKLVMNKLTIQVEAAPVPELLTEMQHRVYELRLQGMTFRAIGERLGKSRATVQEHFVRARQWKENPAVKRRRAVPVSKLVKIT